MNKKLLITALLALVALAGQGQVHYRLEGNIGHPEFTGVMEMRDVFRQKVVGTIEVVKGVITPKEGDLPEMAMCILADTTKTMVQRGNAVSMESALELAFLFIDNGTTTVEGLKENWLLQNGTPVSREITAVRHRMKEITVTYGRNKAVEGKQVMGDYLYEVIGRHVADVYGIYLLVNEGQWYLKPQQWVDLYEKMMAANGDYILASPHLSKYLRYTHEEYRQKVAMLSTDEGCKFVDFAVDYDGKTTRLSDFVGHGQYVLADFWASWCGPCRREIPNIIAAYEKYKGRGLQVIGIAAWDKPKDTLKAIEEEKITYPQIINSQKIATDLYGIKGIPHIILFGPDGTILARGLRGDAIEKKLSEIFKDK